MEPDLAAVAEALAAADAEHAADIDRLAGMDEAALSYLAGVETLPDPDSDGIEADCI